MIRSLSSTPVQSIYYLGPDRLNYREPFNCSIISLVKNFGGFNCYDWKKIKHFPKYLASQTSSNKMLSVANGGLTTAEHNQSFHYRLIEAIFKHRLRY